MRLTIILTLALIACNPENEKDDTSSTDVTTNPDGQFASDCEFESIPTPFTGGLVYLKSLVPYGGEYTFEPDFLVVESEIGTIDWDAGTWESVYTYPEGYTVISATFEGTFSYNSENGNWSADIVSSRTDINKTSSEVAFSMTKEGCTTTTVQPDGEGNTSTKISELVAANQKNWTQHSAPDVGDGWVFDATGSDFEDKGLTTYSFVTDDTSQEPTPDREGTCYVHSTGETECDMTQYFDNGNWQEHHNEWEFNGDWTDEWESYSPDEADPYSWGTSTGTFEGYSNREWYRYDSEGQLVSCYQETNSDGSGYIECSDGTYEEY